MNPLVACAVCALLTTAVPGDAAEAPDPRQMLKQVFAPQAGLQDYTCTATVSIKSPQVHMDDVSATMYFKQPSKYHFESKSGVGMFPKRAFSMDWVSERLTEKANLELVESKKRDGVTIHRIRVTSPESPNREGHLDLLIDGDNHLLKGVEVTSPSRQTPSMKMTHKRIAGKFWLPTKTVLTSPGPRGGEVGTFTMTFTGYKVNVGLSDDLFKEEPKSQGRSRGWRHGKGKDKGGDGE